MLMTLSPTLTAPGSMANSDLSSGTVYYDYDGPRTNNHVEGWHSRLKRIMGKPHPNIFEIVDVVRKEQATIEMKLEQYAAGATQPPRKKLEVHSMR